MNTDVLEGMLVVLILCGLAIWALAGVARRGNARRAERAESTELLRQIAEGRAHEERPTR